MKTRNLTPLVITVLCVAGCQPYGDTRPEIKGNGQGGIEMRRVANTPPPPSTQQAAVENLQSQQRQQQDEIESLQAKIRAQDEEIRRLKQTPATQP